MTTLRLPYRRLGATGLRISAVSFGAGPVSALMTEGEPVRQLDVLRSALEAGINWFDTAPGYGQGESERNLGAGLRRLGAASDVHVATKVRLAPEHLAAVGRNVKTSLAGSLERLGLPSVTLVQLHNAVTRERGDQPDSLTPQDVLGPGGVLAAFEALRAEGLVRYLGLTGTGDPAALREVIRSGAFQAIQVPYNLLNPSAGGPVSADFEDTDYGNIMADCRREGMGVLAIRVLAGGALAGDPPSAHTHRTKYFPLDLYRRDQQRAAEEERRLPPGVSLKEHAIRFALSHPAVSSALIGFGAPSHVEEAHLAAAAGPQPV